MKSQQPSYVIDFARSICTATVAVCLGAAMIASASGADWGALKGRFVFDGKAEKPEPLNVNKDVEFCKPHNPVDESLVVGEDRGLANIFVYLYVKRGKSVEIHPDRKAVSKEPAVLDNKGCRFEPHVMLLRVGQTLEIKNSDSVGHNTNFQTLKNPAFNETVANGASITKSFQKSESIPSSVACNIHPWMKSYVLVREDPYMAVSDANGRFEIANLPAGKQEFILWHEACGNLRNLAVGNGKTSRKGRVKLSIPAGDVLDLGDIKISPKVLGR